MIIYKKTMHIWIVLFFLTRSHDCNGQTITQMNNLSSTLLSVYNKHTRPINNQINAVNVNISLSLIALMDLDEVLGKLSTIIMFSITWTDESLVWDPSLNNGITKMTVSQNDVWKPLLTLVNPYGVLTEMRNKHWVTIKVRYDGSMSWSPLNALNTKCSIDTTYYPFDIQTCKIEMFTYGYDEDEIAKNVVGSKLDLTFYDGHASWKVVRTTLGKGTRNGEKLILVATVTLERQPIFIIVTFLIPILGLALLNPLVFLLPTDCGERVGYSITILLALSVFMTILADYIPKSSLPMSLAAFMLMILYVCSASIVLGVIISTRIYFTSETRPVNSIARVFVRICSLQSRTTSPSYLHAQHRDFSTNDTREIAYSNTTDERKNSIAESRNMKQVALVNDITWKDASRAFDKCFLVVMYIVVFLVSVVFIAILRTGK